MIRPALSRKALKSPKLLSEQYAKSSRCSWCWGPTKSGIHTRCSLQMKAVVE